MKKAASFISLIFCLMLIFQVAVTYFKTNHHVEYVLVKEEQEFKIDEEYINNNNEHYYQLLINNSNNENYSFLTNIDYNKQKQIIKDLYYYQNNNMSCLAPVFAYETKVTQEPVCYYNNQQYSLSAAKNINNNVETFINDLIQKDLYNDKFMINNEVEGVKTSTFYMNNIPEGMYLGVWDYRNLNIAGGDRLRKSFLSVKDIYNNNLAQIINKYYMMPSFDLTNESSAMNVVDMTLGKITAVDFPKPLNNNSYIQGEHEGELYIFDRSNLVQYAVNPAAKVIRVVGNESLGGQLFNGTEFVSTPIYSFRNDDLYFGLSSTTKELLKDYKFDHYFEDLSSYYLISNNQITRVNKNNINNNVIILNENNLQELKYANGIITYIKNDAIYMYHPEYGIKILAKNPELQYNHTNIYFPYYE